MQLQGVADELGTSASVVAIGTDSPEGAAELAADLGLEFPIISDPEATVATSLGVVHPEPFGRGPVPYPTTIVLDAEGRITWVRVGEDVADRADPDAILAAVRGISP